MIDINEIVSKITEEKDNLMAKAFTMQIGMLLRNNGIIPIAAEYTKQDIDNITDANEYKLVHEYGVVFKELDTSEHDEQIRADERAKIIDLIDRHMWNYSKEVWEDFQPVLEQLKEQKIDG